MRTVIPLLMILVAGCNTPGPDFRGIPAHRMTIGPSMFDIRVTGRRAQALRLTPEWPFLAKMNKDSSVYVIPRAAVRSISYPWWGNLKLELEPKSIQIVPTVIYRPRIVKFMRRLGWEL